MRDRRQGLEGRLDRAAGARQKTGKSVAVVGSGPAGLAARSSWPAPAIR
jgi:NADPH-dependent glutamate synthase beta subunit-like oxidoreductase